MLTSEQQKIYNVKVPKGGYGYYTLYHGIYDPTNNIDERPVYAQTGDLFEPEGSSVVYKATRKNGKTTWAIAEDAQRQSESGESGSGGGSSLPSMTGKSGKILGVTLDAQEHEQIEWVTPPSGGAEKFIVTFTEQNENLTADKTIAEIAEAKEAGDIVVGVYTSFDAPFEIPCIVAQEMQSDGETAAIAMFSGPIAGENCTRIATIYGIPDGGSDEWDIELSDINSSVSYNDLDDKPFYEETVSPGINYQIPYTDGTNADESYHMSFAGTTAVAYLYRICDALTASQLEGATVSKVSSAQGGGDETSTVAITSELIVSVTNGRYVMSDGFPLVFVADTDDVDIDIQDVANFNHLNAGTYLIYINADSLQEGAHLYSTNLSKAAVTTVHKLNAKFYDSYAPLIVTLNAQGVGDKTYGEAMTAAQAGRIVMFKSEIIGVFLAQSITYSSDNILIETNVTGFTSVSGGTNDTIQHS